MTEQEKNNDLLSLTAQIVSSYVSNNTVKSDEIPLVIDTVYRSLSSVTNNEAAIAADRPQPAVPIKRSITPDYLICLEDGKQLKMLKRHLKTAYNMTPEEYRERWGLQADYPMVAPNYAARRSRLARDSGLGTRPK